MQHSIQLPVPAKLLISAMAGTLLWILLTSRPLPFSDAVPHQPRLAAAQRDTGLTLETAVEPAVRAYLDNDFCADDLCPGGSWSEWILITPDNAWTVVELEAIRSTLLSSLTALDDAGYDGYGLLRGYRFRNIPRRYLDARRGVLGRVQHDRHEILLADWALTRGEGLYLYHELGHVVDHRLERALTHEFQRLTLGETGAGRERTAGGFWLDSVARERPEEATADAFALWVMLRHTADPQPVFWNKPDEADFEKIAGVAEAALQHIAVSAAGRRNGRS